MAFTCKKYQNTKSLHKITSKIKSTDLCRQQGISTDSTSAQILLLTQNNNNNKID